MSRQLIRYHLMTSHSVFPHLINNENAHMLSLIDIAQLFFTFINNATDYELYQLMTSCSIFPHLINNETAYIWTLIYIAQLFKIKALPTMQMLICYHSMTSHSVYPQIINNATADSLSLMTSHSVFEHHINS